MKLSYTCHNGSQHTLSWRQHRKGAELVLSGPGYQPAGFSLGTYAPGDLLHALDSLCAAPSRPQYDWRSLSIIHEAVYIHTKPAAFATCQGHETRLSSISPEWEEHYSQDLWPSQTISLHVHGEREWHRFLGRFHYEHGIAFIREGITTGTPRRIQRRRLAGWRLPPLTIYVGRPSKWGNPWTVASYYAAGYRGTEAEARQCCVDAYRAWLLGRPHWAHSDPLPPPPDPMELRGYNLACWCPEDASCHADVLLEFANPDCTTIKLPSGNRAPLEKKAPAEIGKSPGGDQDVIPGAACPERLYETGRKLQGD